MNLRPLHNLYQTISPASLLENEEPLIAISKLQRKGNTPSGDIQWVIGVGTQAEQEIWWETRLNASEIEGLSNQVELSPLFSDLTTLADPFTAAQRYSDYSRDDGRRDSNELE